MRLYTTRSTAITPGREIRLEEKGDFYTSSNLDPIFGQLLARRFTSMANELGVPPESFTVVELGAGAGLLARDILRSQRFPYRILERSAAMRERQQQVLKDLRSEWIDELPESITGLRLLELSFSMRCRFIGTFAGMAICVKFSLPATDDRFYEIEDAPQTSDRRLPSRRAALPISASMPGTGCAELQQV
jgi:hypothetical protein